MKRVILYARTSGDDSKKEDRNLEGQISDCREYAIRQGYEIVQELSEDDRGVSGVLYDTEQLKRIYLKAQNGEFDVLIVREINRLARTLAKQLFLKNKLRDNGIRIEYVLANYEDTPEGNLHENLEASISEYDRLKIRERLLRGKHKLVKNQQSVLVAGQAPYGYKAIKQDHKWIFQVYEPEAQIVRMIFEWYTLGEENGNKLVIYGIAKKLTELRIPTRYDTNGEWGKIKQSDFGVWVPSQVGQILNNETYIGKWYFGKRGAKGKGTGIEKIEVKVPAIITDELWIAAQKQRKNNIWMAKMHKYDYLLSGRVRCGLCGSGARGYSLTSHGYHYLYYRCNSKRGYTKELHKCTLPMYRADIVDDAIWQWIRGILSDPKTIEEGLQSDQQTREQQNAQLRERILVLDKLLNDYRKQLDRLLDIYITGEIPKEMLLDRKVRLEDTIDGFEREKESLEKALSEKVLSADQINQIYDFATMVGKGLEEADKGFSARRKIIELLDVTAQLTVEDGSRVIYAQCILTNGASVNVLYNSNSIIRICDIRD